MSGNSDELIRAYLDRYCVEWRLLDTVEATTECTIFGIKLNTPIMLGGMGHYDRLRPGGASEYAQAAAQAGSAMWTGFCTDEEFEKVLQVGVPVARIMKPFADKDILFRAIHHDEAVGACAFAIDIDHAYNKKGRRDVFFEKPLTSFSREDLAGFARSTHIPVFAKGVTSIRDAVICAEAGLGGIVLSNHQNLFPWTVPPVKVLPEIRKAVGKDFTVLVDSGLNSGYDVFKALAWGADGVFTVRQMIPLFREGGSKAVADRLMAMTEELRSCLSRTGAEDIYHIDQSVLREL